MKAQRFSEAELRRSGFTLIELVVLIGIVTVLAATLLPAHSRAQQQGSATRCLNNLRKLTAAWRMYADDNTELLPPNDYPYKTSFVLASTFEQNEMKNWVVGTMASAVDAADPNQTLLASQTMLSSYITRVGTYKCPDDNVLIEGHLNCRSYSMSSAVGTKWHDALVNGNGAVGDPVSGGWLSLPYADPDPNYVTFGKMTSFLAPGPANTWVLADENPLSINDGCLDVSMTGTEVVDYPSGLHAGGCGIAFVDGHSEIHKWKSPFIYSPPLNTQLGQLGDSELPPGDTNAAQDLAWLAAHTTVHK